MCPVSVAADEALDLSIVDDDVALPDATLVDSSSVLAVPRPEADVSSLAD